MTNNLYFLAMVLCIHELGHYIAYRVYGYKPNFVFRFGNLYVGENVFKDVKIKEAFIITISGIIAGLIPVLLFERNLMWSFAYYVMCTIDIALLYGFANEKNWNIKIKEIGVDLSTKTG